MQRSPPPKKFFLKKKKKKIDVNIRKRNSFISLFCFGFWKRTLFIYNKMKSRCNSEGKGRGRKQKLIKKNW
jgi:hypothetical protein